MNRNDIIKKILDLIYTSVISEGGDGDALWLSKYIPLSEIKQVIDSYNVENNTGWKVEEKSEKYLMWSPNEENAQEFAIITNDRELYNIEPKWIILRIEY